VLEVATGPGYVALGFARACREVVGIDLTPALLQLAEGQRKERGIANAHFQVGDAGHLPFDDGEFDAVVCRFAFHHFPDPLRVLQEMARVCRANGKVAVEDLVVSEIPERAAYQNRFEQLRDPSHTRAYPLSQLLALFTVTALEVETVYSDALVPDVEAWFVTAQTPAALAAEARAMIQRDAVEDLSGARPFERDGTLHFVQRTAALVSRRLIRP
jgi:SAM-dependent methyltransferase